MAEERGTERPKGRRRRGRGCLLWSLGALVALLVAGWVIYGGGQLEDAGTITEGSPPDDIVAGRARRQTEVAPASARQILFGDLHVHTTFSGDAFMMSLPLLGGEGAHPPADACDFARWCSDLDFFALTDHAEALTPHHWDEAKESIRQCNRLAGEESGDPDLVAFMGFEWSQVGATPAEHYGHKNVIFRETSEDRLPPRPIGSRGLAGSALQSAVDPSLVPLVPIIEFPNRQRYLDLAAFFQANAAVEDCPDGVDSRELPPDCREFAATPQVLFEKLDQHGFDALVIPHGMTWGFYTPGGYRWDKQISAEQDDPDRQRLVEVYSGHGNSEEYRDFQAVEHTEDGPVCPEPTDAYEPCCWRAGEIIRERCGDVSEQVCERRVEEARRNYVLAGIGGRLTVPGAEATDWGECGQCTDCFNPSFNYRPGGAAQYIIARGNFDDPEAPRHHVMGFIASSDNHTARPGTGYKEIHRRRFTEATGPLTEEWRDRVWGPPEEDAAESVPRSREWLTSQPPFLIVDFERQASFFMTGGLVAVHAERRDRESIWQALNERHVYGTSGDRILLWFDLVNAEDGTVARPMGAEVPLGRVPRFRVRAAGSFEQLPGCPEYAEQALGSERLENVCANECYYPSDVRRRITRVEIVRIRPQRAESEDVATLIEDPWKVLECPPDAEACEVEFDDPDFVQGARDVAYYARAIQEPTMAVNAGGMRCTDEGCSPCYGDWRTPLDDDCLFENEERAWSSPIWVRYDEAAAEAEGEGEPTVDAGTQEVR